MEEVKFCNVEQVLRRVVKSDGRVGGLQAYSGQTVDVITYETAETEPDTNEGDENR